MKRKIYLGIASATVIALALTIGIFGKSMINANAQTTNLQKTNNSATQANTVVLTEKAQPSESASTTVSNAPSSKPYIEVPVNLEVEKGDQKNADKGSAPWKLDPVFVSQVFVSLQVSPAGIQGDFPVKEGELKLVKGSESEAEVKVDSSKTNITKVYLKKLVKQGKSGIWTVVGYDKES